MQTTTRLAQAVKLFHLMIATVGTSGDQGDADDLVARALRAVSVLSPEPALLLLSSVLVFVVAKITRDPRQEVAAVTTIEAFIALAGPELQLVGTWWKGKASTIFKGHTVRPSKIDGGRVEFVVTALDYPEDAEGTPLALELDEFLESFEVFDPARVTVLG